MSERMYTRLNPANSLAYISSDVDSDVWHGGELHELVPAELMDAFRKANSEYCSGHHSWCNYKVFRDTCHCGYAEIEALL